MTTHVVAFAYPSANQEDPQLGVTLIQSRGKFFGYVDAPDQKAAEVEAAKGLHAQRVAAQAISQAGLRLSPKGSFDARVCE